MKKAIIIMTIAASLTACNKTKTAETSPEATKTTETTETTTKGDDEKVAYACPMDCEKGKTYDQPGKCPKCEMDLEKK